MAFEIAEQMDWRWPDWMIYPTGGGTGMVGMWKAFEELEQNRVDGAAAPAAHGIGAGGGMRSNRARVPRGRAEGDAVGGRGDGGRRPPRAQGDRRLPDSPRRPRERRNGVDGDGRGHDRRHAGDLGSREGISAAPEGGATLAALECLLRDGTIKAHEPWCSSTPAAP